jgi:hypothetical protein
MEAQLKPLQNEATSGAGKTLTVPDPERIVWFLIRSKGPRVIRCRRGGAHLSFGPPSAARAKEHTRHEAR